MTPRVLLILSTHSYRAGAFVDAARDRHVPVAVASDRAQALAHLEPSRHVVVDLADPEAAATAMVAHAREHPVQAVIAADDEGVVAAAIAAERLGLAHASREAVETLRDKLRFRQAMARAGLSRLGFVETTDDPAGEWRRRVRYPAVVKPRAMGASRGVVRVDDPSALDRALTRVRALVRNEGRAGGLLVEDYVPGREVALEGLVTEGRLQVLALFDKPDPLVGPTFEETIYVTPSRRPEAEQRRVRDRVAAALDAVGFRHGPIHAELRLPDGDAEPHVLEIAPRSIGGLCSRALRFDAGASLESVLLRHALGEPVDAIAREPAASGVMMVPIPAAGILYGVDGVERARQVPGVDEVRITIPVGHPVVTLPEGARYLGFIFARGARPEDAEASLRRAHETLQFDIRPQPRSGAPETPGALRSAPGDPPGRGATPDTSSR